MTDKEPEQNIEEKNPIRLSIQGLYELLTFATNNKIITSEKCNIYEQKIYVWETDDAPKNIIEVPELGVRLHRHEETRILSFEDWSFDKKVAESYLRSKFEGAIGGISGKSEIEDIIRKEEFEKHKEIYRGKTEPERVPSFANVWTDKNGLITRAEMEYTNYVDGKNKIDIYEFNDEIKQYSHSVFHGDNEIKTSSSTFSHIELEEKLINSVLNENYKGRIFVNGEGNEVTYKHMTDDVIRNSNRYIEKNTLEDRTKITPTWSVEITDKEKLLQFKLNEDCPEIIGEILASKNINN